MMMAQDSLSMKRIKPSFWVDLYANDKKVMTKLYEVKDSSLVISKTSRLVDYQIGNFEPTELNIRQIKSIKYWNSNNIFVGMVSGAIAGIVVGALIGKSEEDSPDSWLFSGRSAESKALEDIVGGALIGAGAGALAGLIRISIPLNGSYANYSKYKSKLEERSVKYKYFSGR